MLIASIEESRGLNLEGVVNSVEDFGRVLIHPIKAMKPALSLPGLQERFERRELVGCLEERGYYDADTQKAVLIALDLAAHIHRGEYRKLGIVYSGLLEKIGRPSEVLAYPFKHPLNVIGDFSSGKFLRIYLSHPRAVAGDLIKMRADFATIAAALFHDTVESLLKVNPNKTKEECLDYVMNRFNGMVYSSWSSDCYGNMLQDMEMQKAFESKFLSQVDDIRAIDDVLTRDRTIDYLTYLFGISHLSDENALKAFSIKFVDQGKNNLENHGLSYEDIIRAGFKSTLLANVALLFAKKRGLYDDVKNIFGGIASKNPHINLFGFLLMDLIEKTRSAQSTEITADLKKTAGNFGDHISSRRYQEIDGEATKYREAGGFKSITEPGAMEQSSPATRHHGTLLRLAADMRRAVPMAPTREDFYRLHGREQGQRHHNYAMYTYSRILQEILTDVADKYSEGPIKGLEMLKMDSPAYQRFIDMQNGR